VRKALELPLALWIDLVIPKRRQMGIYLNVAQWGPSGEFGAEAAARRAFGKPASALSLGESAMLAATLPNPIRRNAKAPSSTLRRLAATYTACSAARGDIDRCVRPPRPAWGGEPSPHRPRRVGEVGRRGGDLLSGHLVDAIDDLEERTGRIFEA
jgi:hypothetical protein